MSLIQNNKVDLLTTQNLDMHQRRLMNAADAVDSNDYTTLEQVNKLILDSSTVPFQFPTIIKAATITLAKLTGGGTNGSISFDKYGRVTAYVLPT